MQKCTFIYFYLTILVQNCRYNDIMQLLTQSDLTKIFNVNLKAITELVNAGRLPYEKIEGGSYLFCTDALIRHVTTSNMENEKLIEQLKRKLWEANPSAMKAIEEFGAHIPETYTPRIHYLNKIANKKLGHVWYVRYIENGVVIPSHWSTGTNDREKAERWAVENRERLLNKYFNRKTVKKPYGELYDILRKYYSKGSKYLEVDFNRGKSLGNNSRNAYHNFITKQFIPYLKKQGIKNFEEIDTPFLARFQNYLLAGRRTKKGITPGIKPQTIKIYMLTISNIFNHLLISGHVKTNPCKSLIKLKIKNEQIRGCYEITRLKGVFNKAWENQTYYLLCLVIYTTGIRNSEIERMRVSSLITIDGIHFIDIAESKTRNGVRIVPLHDFVFRKLTAYIKKAKKKPDELIFKKEGTVKILSRTYENANAELAKFTRYTKEMLEEENITFYSGRHFWKTLMDCEKLGDIEEYFMGHKVSSNVAKRYNHKDKQGKKKLLERAKRVLQILDKHIFT